MTKYIKKSELENNWYEIDANGVVVGRLATIISKIIRGKNKTTYTPHMDNGDFVVVKNIEQIKFTGQKFQNKKYFRHTGYPGGIKSRTAEDIIYSKQPENLLKMAIKRMLSNNKLARKQLSNLKVFAEENHSLVAQKPREINFLSMNRKNG